MICISVIITHILHIFCPFCSASPEIIGLKVCHRWTDRQTNSLTSHRGYTYFFSVKFATSLLTSLAGGISSDLLFHLKMFGLCHVLKWIYCLVCFNYDCHFGNMKCFLKRKTRESQICLKHYNYLNKNMCLISYFDSRTLKGYNFNSLDIKNEL